MNKMCKHDWRYSHDESSCDENTYYCKICNDVKIETTYTESEVRVLIDKILTKKAGEVK